MADKKDEADTRVRRIIVRVACGAGLAMVVWAGFVLLWALWPEPNDFTVPGTFGDAFAPVVGLMNSLVLGAAIASVLMQREELQSQRDEMELQRQEMQPAREQYTAQAAALKEANKHADRTNTLANRANELARSGQLLETQKQIADLDLLAGTYVEARKASYAAIEALKHRDPLSIWHSFALADDNQRLRDYPPVLNTAELRDWAKRRSDLVELALMVRVGLTGVKPEPPGTDPQEPA